MSFCSLKGTITKNSLSNATESSSHVFCSIKLGPNGYYFAIDPNGYVLLHPNLQPKVRFSLIFLSLFLDIAAHNRVYGQLCMAEEPSLQVMMK